LDKVYRERAQQEKKLKEQQKHHAPLLPGGASSSGGAGPNAFFAKHEDPLIKAEIDKNLKEQRKLLE
jgi:hypothetical protein